LGKIGIKKMSEVGESGLTKTWNVNVMDQKQSFIEVLLYFYDRLFGLV
jgi:hypothetical protein